MNTPCFTTCCATNAARILRIISLSSGPTLYPHPPCNQNRADTRRNVRQICTPRHPWSNPASLVHVLKDT